MQQDQVIAQTKRWIDLFVIGLNLCPFARRPFLQDRIRYVVLETTQEERLAEAFLEEAVYLQSVAPELVETTLIIHPDVLIDFYEYNDFLPKAEWLLQQAGLEGTLQVASFHPGYRFAGTEAKDVENYTNRSPYPMLHLLREDSIEAAVGGYAHPEEIPQRNVETMKRLGEAGIKTLYDKLV